MITPKVLQRLLGSFEKKFATHNRIEVSRSALLHNFDFFSEATQKHVIPVLKGNAYGHGIEQVATALKDRKMPYIAVDGYFEALRIRTVSAQPVLIMGAIKNENFARLRYDNFAFVVQDMAAIDALAATRKKINVHIEINTGMNRYGGDPDDVMKLVTAVNASKHLRLEGLMSHLADSDGDTEATVADAVAVFDDVVSEILKFNPTIEYVHIGQTAGSLREHSRYANTMRLGIGLYGLSPFAPKHPLEKQVAQLRPALKLISTVTKLTELKKGDQVSYNYTFTAPKDMRIAVLPFGYYEGLPRLLSNVGSVKSIYGDQKITGRVCMNHTMIDDRKRELQIGDEITVYSNNPKDKNCIDAIVANSLPSFNNYNVLTMLSRDVRRILVD